MPGLVLPILLLSACVAQAAERPSFTETFADAPAWRTNSPASSVSVSPGRVTWKLPALQPELYYLERALPVAIDPSYELHVKVTCDSPTALEIQLATENLGPRLFRIEQFRSPGTHELRLPVRTMGAFSGFDWATAKQPLFVRFWIDGSPDWAGGAVPRGKEIALAFSDLSVSSPLAGLPEGIDAQLTVDPSTVVGTVHPHVYGQFLEHIYHSVEGGLFGELLANRAFVGAQGFHMDGDTLAQSAMSTDIKTFAGDPAWTDYEFSLQARKTGGVEGFLILFRAATDQDFYWWNLGGWGNQFHALEREVNDGRAIISDRTPGHIDPDRWYEIRVRVEGDHLEGWLDGQKLLDVRDAAHARGRVGVGTWGTAAEFRGFRVTDLGGRELPVDFAAGLKADQKIEGWQVAEPAEGAVSFVPDPSSPNTGIVARLELAQEACGLSQEPINIVKGHRYHGVAWLRADGKAEVTARLTDAAGEKLGEAKLPSAKADWTECRFHLEPSRSEPNGRLTLLARGTGTLSIDMVSLMRDDSLKTGCRADLLEAVRGLQPTIIRWPGGCFASIFRWKNTLGTQRERKPFYNAPWGEWDSGGFGTDEFIRLCREVGAEPLIVLNLGSWDSPGKWETYLQEALDWVEYCNGDASTPMGKLRARNGHPEPYNVTHWELDNETWGMGLESYAERLIPFAKAIKERWPNVTLYACTFWEGGDPKLLGLAGEYFDLISYHLYDDPNAFGVGPLNHESVWSRYPEFIADSPNPKVGLAVTEWNAQSTDWRTGLFAAGLLNVFERQDAVRMATPALFLRRVDAPAWDNAFINHDHVSWFPAPNYVVMQLYRQHYQPNRVQLISLGSLNAVATASADGKTVVLKVVNAQPEDVTCTLQIVAPFKPKTGRRWTVQAGLEDRNTLAEPHKIVPVESKLADLDAASTVTFPAYSVTLLELK